MLGLLAIRAFADVVCLELEGIGSPGADNVLADSSVDVGDIGALFDPVVGCVGQGKVVVESKGKGALRVAEVEGADKDLVLVLGVVLVRVSTSC